MREDDAIRVRHMLDAAREALEFAQGRTRKAFDEDRMLVLSISKDIEIIGEAASRVTECGRKEMDGIPWEEIIAMRHRLVHAYFNINLDILWQTVREDLPGLISLLEPFAEAG